jgi:hypothetical protein
MTDSGLVAPATTAVLKDVADERGRQDAKWGEQNHPDGTGPVERQFAVEQANAYRDICDTRAEMGLLTFADILLEEVFEALAESDPEKLAIELVQVSAVAVSWVEAIKRRRLAAEVVAEVPEPQEVPC